MASFKVFLVEDDPWYGELLSYHLSHNPDYQISLFRSAKECLDSLYLMPDVICIDFVLPDMLGDELLERIKAINNSIPIVIISGQSDISVAINLLKAGATDYIIKDDNTQDLLWNALLKIRENSVLKREVERLKGQLIKTYDFGKLIIGQSTAIKKTLLLVEKTIKSNINVSLTGETGTGKEVFARTIHYNSDRHKKAFVAVNMAAIPKELVETELFGHEKGSFTGASNRKIGKFEEAEGGTIFLDEIGDMDLALQSKMLRVLQEREIMRVGSNKKIKLNVRLITATHRNLADEVEKGNFREDLYYRIMGLPIQLPPLVERGNDILILAKHFAALFAEENNQKHLSFTEAAKNKLMKYHYPGNVRELRAIIELACVMCNGIHITEEDISFFSSGKHENILLTEKTLREYTCDIIQGFLNKYDHDVILVSEKLAIGKSTIYNMAKQGEVVLGK